jgi:hypothetical protein
VVGLGFRIFFEKVGTLPEWPETWRLLAVFNLSLAVF